MEPKELTDEERRLSVAWVYADKRLEFPIVLQDEE